MEEDKMSIVKRLQSLNLAEDAMIQREQMYSCIMKQK
jgi:hypothetical protein